MNLSNWWKAGVIIEGGAWKPSQPLSASGHRKVCEQRGKLRCIVDHFASPRYVTWTGGKRLGVEMSPGRLCWGGTFCPAAEYRPSTEWAMGPVLYRPGPGGESASEDSTADPTASVNKAEPWRGSLTCSSLSPAGKSLESLSNQGNLANVADGQEWQCAWPEVENEVGCLCAEQGQESRGPREGGSESCQAACQARLTESSKSADTHRTPEAWAKRRKW